MRTAFVPVVGALLSVWLFAGCNGASEEVRTLESNDSMGAVRAALVVPPSMDESCPGIEGLRVSVYDADGQLVESSDTHIKDQSFPSDLFPGLTSADGTALEQLGAGHQFGDAYFVLMPGTYRVEAMAIDADGQPHDGCQPAETEVVVHAGATTEVFLLLQCECGTGGVDVVVLLNCPPVIWELSYNPNKFICCYEDLNVTVQAEDPDGDDFFWSWELVTPQPVPDDVHWEALEGNLVFHGPVGNYEFRVTVTDTTGASSSLVFPIHVMGEASGCDACVAPPDCVAAEEFSWDCSTSQWTENVSCVDGALTLDQAQNCAGGSRLWAPSTGNGHVVLFDLPSGGVAGDFPLPEDGCGPSRVARDSNGNAYVTCSNSGTVYRMNQDGLVLGSVDLGGQPYGCTALGGVVVLHDTGTVYVGCEARGDGPGFVLALNGHSLQPVGTVQSGSDELAISVNALATEGGYVFAAGRDDNQLVAFDPSTNEVLWSFPARPYAIAVRNNLVWYTVAGENSGQVCRVRGGYYAPAEAECLDFGLASVQTPDQQAVVGKGVAIHPADGHVWAAVSDANAVVEIDQWTWEIVAVHRTAVSDPTAIAFDAEGNAYVLHGGRVDGQSTDQDGVVMFSRDADTGLFGSPVLFGRSVLVNTDVSSSDLTGSAQCFPIPGFWKRIYAFGCPGQCKQVTVDWNADLPVEVKTLIGGVWDVAQSGVPFQTEADEMEVRVRLEAFADGSVPTLFDLDVSYESPCL